MLSAKCWSCSLSLNVLMCMAWIIIINQLVNIVAVDGLAPGINRPSAAMVMTEMKKFSFPFRVNGNNITLQCQQMI